MFQERDFENDLTASIDDWAHNFYKANAPGSLVRIWSKRLHRRNWDEDFVNSAIDVIVERIGMALKDNNVRQEWRLPHIEVTEQKIAAFLLADSNFLHCYAEKAKYLTQLLKGLLQEDEPDQNLSNKARKRRKA